MDSINKNKIIHLIQEQLIECYHSLLKDDNNLHPWYGPCNRFNENNTCTECNSDSTLNPYFWMWIENQIVNKIKNAK